MHINYLLTHGQYPLVAELNGRVVGELELYVGEEREVLGRTAFIDVLEVHRDFRGVGVGRSLINKARGIAEEHECNTLSVWPVREAVGFYRKCGLVHTAYIVINLELKLGKLPGSSSPQVKIQEFPGKYSLLKDMVFVAPRIFSSFTAWIKSRWKYAVEVGRIFSIEGCLPGMDACFILESMWGDRSKGEFRCG